METKIVPKSEPKAESPKPSVQDISATTTEHSPWYIVPADDKENARLTVSQIVLDTFDDLQMTYPKVTAGRRMELLEIRRQLEK